VSHRVNQILVGYVGGSWGVLQFLDWIVTHYELSKSITEAFLYFVVLMLPGVLLLAWSAWRAERAPIDKRVVRVGVPLNVLVAGLLLFIVFHGKRLGATTEVVAVHDDSGALVERRVPKSEFRKRVALFPFESPSGDPAQAWLQHGVAQLFSADLEQDPFVVTWGDYSFKSLLHRAHLNADSVVPLSLARQAALSMHIDFFVTGTVHKEGAQYRLRASLYSSQSGRRVSEREADGADLFALVDQLSLEVRRDMGIPAAHIESAPDLPVSEITTKSLPALAELTLALNRRFEDDPAGELVHLQKAVAIDPTFALADFQLFIAYFQTHDQGKTQHELERTLANVYKLPEPTRFLFNSIRYQLEGHIDKQEAVLTNWVTLYPDSPEARARLGDHYRQRDQRQQALASYHEALALDPSDTRTMNKVVALHMQNGELEPALAIYRRFLTQFPNDADTHTELADQYLAAARFAEARQSYARALALDADQVRAAIGLTSVDFALGQRDTAVEALHKLLGDFKLPRDRLLIYDELISDYALRGQMKLALATFIDRQRDNARVNTPMNVAREQLDQTRLYVRAGRVDEARQLLADNAADARANVNVMFSLAIAQLELDDELDDAKALTEHLPALESAMRTFGLEEVRAGVLQFQARIRELSGDWAGALKAWQESEKLDRSSPTAAIGVGRCLMQTGDLDGARAQLKRATARFVSKAEAYYELARVDREHDPRAARTALATALAIWAPGDADYKRIQAARALAATLGMPAKP
jgi:tetratricopeptide (TPR) repeat protein/TolB-like protein